MADEEDVAALLDEPLGLAVDLGDERAGGVEEIEPARARGRRDRLGDAVGGEDHRHAVRHLVEIGDEHRALRLQTVDDELVVNDFVADVDRRAVPLQRQLDDADRPVDTRAEAARRGDVEGEGGLGGGHDGVSGLYDAGRARSMAAAVEYRCRRRGALPCCLSDPPFL